MIGSARGATSIPDFRADAVRPDGNFEGFEALICVDDDEAIKQSRRLVDRGAIELWSGERFITRMEHEVKVMPSPDAFTGLKTIPGASRTRVLSLRDFAKFWFTDYFRRLRLRFRTWLTRIWQ
jgi:hypothetical protein